MVIGNFVGAKFAELFSPIYAVILSMLLMVVALVANSYLAEYKITVLVMTFLIAVIAFSLSTPIQMAMINTAKGSEMLGSSMNQSAFNMGNASGAYLAGLPIAMGYGFTSSSLVGAAMAASGVFIALGIILVRRKKQPEQQKAIYKAEAVEC